MNIQLNSYLLKTIINLLFIYLISNNWRGMHLNESNGKIKKTRSGFFKGIKKEGTLDGPTFDVWKSELQKDLTNFWESINDSGRR
jgi:hypothetical protein